VKNQSQSIWNVIAHLVSEIHQQMRTRINDRLKMLLLLIILGTIGRSQQLHEVFDEEFFIKPLHSGHVYSYFQFTTQWDIGEEDSRE
jgi:hypothetical protein